MADFANTVKTVYKAETAGAEAAVKRYRGVEREEAKKVLDALNQHNASLQEQISRYAKVAAAVGAAVGAFKLAQTAAKAYLEDVRLESAAGAANIDRLTQATRGLVEHDRLLAFAGKAQHGVWKLNQQAMEDVLHGAMALRKTMGVELEPTIDALTEAITKGSTRALREFGISAKDGKSALAQLREMYQGLHGDVGLTGDSFQSAGVKMHDAWDDLLGQLGRFAVELAPVISAMAEFVGLIGKGIEGLKRLFPSEDLFGSGSPAFMQYQAQIGELDQRLSGLRAEQAKLRGPGAKTASLIQSVGAGGPDSGTATYLFPDAYYNELGKEIAATEVTRNRLKSKAEAALAGFKKKVTTPAATTPYLRDGLAKPEDPLTIDRAVGQVYDAALLDSLAEGRYGPRRGVAGGLGGEGAITGSGGPALEALEKRREADYAAAQDRIERFRSAVLDMNTDIQRAMLQSSDGFNMFRDAAMSAFQILIEGGDNMSMRLRKAFAGILQGQAVKLAGVAIEEGVMAIVDPAMAGKHLAGAAKAAAGAVALGALARGLGGGGPSATAALGAAGGGAGAGAGGGGPVTYQINVVSDFSGDSPRRVTRRLSRALDDVRKQRGGKRAVDFG